MNVLWCTCMYVVTAAKVYMYILYYTYRVNAYIRNGWNKDLVDPDNTANLQHRDTIISLPTDGWLDIRQAPPHTLAFTNAQIISYFVTRTANDGLPAADFKSVNTSASSLYRCGHVQMIEVCHKSNVLCLRANCLPEIKKDRVYKLVMKLDSQSCEIDEAQCGCPAGCGPKASCKHIAALCYALEEFTRLRQLPDFVACTDRLQTWNQPRLKKLMPIPVEDMRTRKQQLMPPPVRACQQTRAVSQFDPCPKEFRAINPETLKNFRCGLLKLNKPCAFTQLLIPIGGSRF